MDDPPDADDWLPAIWDITVIITSFKKKKISIFQFRVHYSVNSTKACCSGHIAVTRLNIVSEGAFFEDGVDPAIMMMNKTIKRIKEHKAETYFDGLHLCDLDYHACIGAYYVLHDGWKESFCVASLVDLRRKQNEQGPSPIVPTF